MSKRGTESIKNFGGLEYVTVIVPVKSSKHGSVIDINPSTLDTLVAKALVEHRVPLRGREVKFLRKSIGLSLEKFAHELDLSAASVFKWERAEEERLHSINEIAVRALLAEKLGIEISGKFSKLVAADSPAPIELKAG